jgi:ATP-dependent RNA helicase DeaD
MEQAMDIADIAAALAYMNQEEQPLFPKMEPLEADASRKRDREFSEQGTRESRGYERSERRSRGSDRERRDRDGSFSDMESPESGMERYYLGVGRMDNVSPRDIVGAIANEANLESKYIGHIKLFEKFSTVDLPESMPEDVLDILRRMTIKNRPSKIRLMTDKPPEREQRSSEYFDRGSKDSRKRDRGDRGGRRSFKGDDQPPKRTRRFGRH